MYIYTNRNTNTYTTDLQMHNADGFRGFSGGAAGGVGSTDQYDVVDRRRLRAARLGVGEDAVAPQGEPPRSPALAVVGPLVEDPGDAGAGADIRSPDISVRSGGGEIDGGAGPQQRRLRRAVADPGALERYAAERVHLLHPHRPNSTAKAVIVVVNVNVNWIGKSEEMR